MHKVTKEILLLLSYVLIPLILYLLLLFFAFTHRLVSSCSWCENPNNLRWITNVKLQNERWKDAKIYYPIYGSITRASWEPCSKWQSISNSRNFPKKKHCSMTQEFIKLFDTTTFVNWLSTRTRIYKSKQMLGYMSNAVEMLSHKIQFLYLYFAKWISLELISIQRKTKHFQTEVMNLCAWQHFFYFFFRQTQKNHFKSNSMRYGSMT